MWKDKRVIVTGAAGVIGSELVERLLNREAVIRCFDIAPPLASSAGKTEYYQKDLSMLNPIEFTSFDPEVVFHLAATFERTEETAEFLEDNFRNNIILSHRIIEGANRCKSLKKFVFASSYLVFSPSLYLFSTPQTKPVRLKETDSMNPRNLCGSAKYFTEKELNFISKTIGTFTSISTRIFRVYGFNSRDVISRWVRAAITGDELIVFHKENMFDYIFASDVAEGLIKIAENVDVNEVINLGGGTGRKIEEVVQIIRTQIPELKVREIERPQLFEASAADTSKLIGLTGWEPHTTLEEGIKRVIDYEKENLRGK